VLKRVFTRVGGYVPYELAFILRSRKYILNAVTSVTLFVTKQI